MRHISNHLMVLESLTNPVSAEKRPLQMILLGFSYASVAMFLSLWIFYQYSSLVMVFLTVLASIPIVYNTIRFEEKKDENETDELILLKEHFKALKVFIFLFFGFTIAYVFWYVFFPQITGALGFVLPFFHTPADGNSVLFQTQTETFYNINGGVTGLSIQASEFVKILLNNTKVLIFCLIFSFIYGLGAIYILAWNASVIGAAVGLFIRKNIDAIVASSGPAKAAAYVQIIALGFLKYSLHGVLEILAYFIGGLAGGIISIAVIKHSFGSKKFETALWDASDLIIISIIVLVVAALIEVFVTPLVF